MSETLPAMRRDLEFIPVQYGDQPIVLVRDHLGLVKEGRGLPVALYQLLLLLDGQKTVVDIQSLLMRQSGGVLVGSEEVRKVIAHLDDTYLLDSARFRKARSEMVAAFTAERVRPCSHCGRAYPAEPEELRKRLDEILSSQVGEGCPEGPVRALVSPHIDLSVGRAGYACAYRMLEKASPSRVVVLGVGHQWIEGLFCLTEKDFETPLGAVRCERSLVQRLRDSGEGVVAPDDFVHRSEHSIEFQILFLQHLLPEGSFTILPILCGSVQACVPVYSRAAFLEKSAPFIETLRKILDEGGGKSLLVAGVDLFHIGPKFGHRATASQLEGRASAHDESLLAALCKQDRDLFWEESIRVMDEYNVCGFSALALLLEVLPTCTGRVLHYEIWHEEATRSAVSFAAAVFSKQ